MVEDRPLVRKAFDALDQSRNVFWQHQIDMSEDFRRACGSMLYKEFFEEDFEVDRQNNRGNIKSTVDQLARIRQKVFGTARKELKLRNL